MSPWAIQLLVDVAAVSMGVFLFSPYIIAAALTLATAVKIFRAKLKD